MKFRKLLYPALALGIALLPVSCKDGKEPEQKEEKVPVESISLDQEEVAAETAQFIELTATVLPENATDKRVVWTSDNEAVASVDGGTVMTNAPGDATIAAATIDGGFVASCKFHITTPLKKITLDPAEATLDERSQLTISVVYPEGATQLPVNWVSSDETVATVDARGVVSGLVPGTAVITAKTQDGKISASCTVTVKDANYPWVESPDGKMYPQGVTVTKFEDKLDGDNYCKGAYAHIDFSQNPDLRFNVLYGNTKTLITTGPGDDVDWYDRFPEEDGQVIILTNAGFFDATWGTSSMVGVDGMLKAKGASTTGLSGYSGNYYPVRSALSVDKSGKFSINWVYPCIDGVYSFTSALNQNDATGVFLPAPPDKTTPGAKKLTYKDLIQGGPRLVENGKNVAELNTRAELLTGTVGKPHGYRTSRTAYGIMPDGSLVVLVVEGDGRNGKANAGFDVCELADKFIEIGCVDALGFDGGGSSEMIGPGCDQIVPRIGGQRAMPTAICISEIRY